MWGQEEKDVWLRSRPSDLLSTDCVWCHCCAKNRQEWIVKLIKQNGDTVTSGEVIAQLDTDAKPGVVSPAATDAVAEVSNEPSGRSTRRVSRADVAAGS